MIPLFKVFMASEVGESVTQVLNSGYVGQGPKVEEFEKLLENKFNKKVLTVNSCTSALHLALRLIKDLPGDEVITTPLTCLAGNVVIPANNLKIRWADVNLNNCNIDLKDVERKLTKNTKAIMFVHWGGNPVDLDGIKEIQDKCFKLYGHRPQVIEDCAHVWDAKYKNRLIGSNDNFCAFSLQAIKFLTTIDGGLLLCPNEEYHKEGKLLRWFGLDRENSTDLRCLYPNSRIRFSNGRTERIAKVVENKLTGPVLVEENGRLIERNIIGWHKNKLFDRKLFSISTKSLYPLYKTIVTEDHLVFTKKKGWISALNLNKNDLILTSFPKASALQEQIIVGSLLGDASVSKRSKLFRATLTETHTKIDEEYIRLKANSLSGLGCKVRFIKPSLERPYGAFQYATLSLPCLAKYRKLFYPQKIKIVPHELVRKNFTPLMLACWFCDDGSVSRILSQRKGLLREAQIATCAFSEEDVQFLVDLLNEHGYQCSKRMSEKKYWRIYFTSEGFEKLIKVIGPYVPNCMKYKICHDSNIIFNQNLWGDGKSDCSFDKAVIEPFENKGYEHVYCLSVEGNSQMFSTSTIMVHNCNQNPKNWGYKFHMSDVNATIGICNYPMTQSLVQKHRENAEYYNNELKNIEGITLLENDNEGSYWIYTIRVKNREKFKAMMTEKGIHVSPVHSRNDIFDCFSEYKCDLPNMDILHEEMIAIPVGWWVTPENRKYIVESIRKGW